jgi:hypothetical protein
MIAPSSATPTDAGVAKAMCAVIDCVTAIDWSAGSRQTEKNRILKRLLSIFSSYMKVCLPENQIHCQSLFTKYNPKIRPPNKSMYIN